MTSGLCKDAGVWAGRRQRAGWAGSRQKNRAIRMIQGGIGGQSSNLYESLNFYRHRPEIGRICVVESPDHEEIWWTPPQQSKDNTDRVVWQEVRGEKQLPVAARSCSLLPVTVCYCLLQPVVACYCLLPGVQLVPVSGLPRERIYSRFRAGRGLRTT